MNTASPLEKLPGDLLVHLMCSFCSPVDLRSFVSASPIFLQWFRTYRQSVLKSMTELLKALNHGETFCTMAIGAVWLRLQAHRLPYLDISEIYRRISRVTKWTPSELEWSGSLPFLCELFIQRQDADELISEYAVDAWNELIVEARDRTKRISSFPWLPEFDQPLVISPSEMSRFEEGFLLFDWCRHNITYFSVLLGGFEWPVVGRFSFDYRSPTPGECKETRRRLRAVQSIFHHVFGKYRTLLHDIDRDLREREVLDSGTYWLENRRICHFLQSSTDQEHRCIIFLSLQGYALLWNIRRMDRAHVRHFILTTFLWVVVRDATRFLPLEDTFTREMTGCGLLTESPSQWMSEPWTRAIHFWDRERTIKINRTQR